MSDDQPVWATDELAGELVGHLRTRIDRTPSAIPDLLEIESRGRRRRTRRRAVAGVMASIVMVLTVAGVGLTIRQSPGQELAASLESQVVVPFTFELRDDGSFVGVAFLSSDEPGEPNTPGPDPAVEAVLAKSDDGLRWSIIEGSVFDLRGTSGVGRPQAIGLALRGGTAVLATASVEVLSLDESPSEDGAEVSLVLAEFDLDARRDRATWNLAKPERVAMVDAQERVVSVEVGTTSDGVLANVTLLADAVQGGLDSRGLDWTDVCGVASDTAAKIVIRRCGSTEILELDAGPTTARTPRTFTIYADADGVSEVRGVGVTSWWEHQLYETNEGVGLVTDSLGETTDGETWTVPWATIGTVGGVAAYDDTRIAFERNTSAPLGPGGPLRGLWISESAALDEVRHHRVVAGESGTHIAADYGIELDDLIAANPGVDVDAFGDSTELDAGIELVIPDGDSTRRGWRSIDLRPAFGPAAATSHLMFHQVAAGPAGFVVALRQVSTVRVTSESLLETESFRVEGPNGVFAGSTPFGPATIRDLDDRIVAEWDHFEVAHPFEFFSIVQRPEGTIVAIDVPGSTDMVFPADAWFEAARGPGQLVTRLVGSVDGVEWRELGSYGSVQLQAIDESAVYFSSWGPLGEIDRIELHDPTE